MLLVKKLMYKVLTLLYKDVQGTASVANVGANSGGVVSVPISVPSGFTPFMATVEEYSNQNLLECHVESLTSNSVVVRYANLRSSSATMNFRVKALCKMWGGVLRNLSIFKAFSDCKPSERMVVAC